jgi:hypothetical protein
MGTVAERSTKSHAHEHKTVEPAGRIPEIDGNEHEHAFEWMEIARVLFVALAALLFGFTSGSRSIDGASSDWPQH